MVGFRNGNVKFTNSFIPNVFQKVQKPLISVIIPVYQEEKILESTLQSYSIELRKKFNLEIIVSDGQSTDSTVEIAKKYADKVVVHYEKHKQTIAEGRNKGAEVALGDIFVFMNGDTVPDKPDDFFRTVESWSKGEIFEDSYALACTVTVIPSEKLLKDSIFYTLHNSYIRFLNLIGVGMGRGECQIIRAEVFKNIGGYNPSIAAGEDFDLYRRLAKIAKISFTNKIKVYESPRRFRKYGYLRIVFSWMVNSLSVML